MGTMTGPALGDSSPALCRALAQHSLLCDCRAKDERAIRGRLPSGPHCTPGNRAGGRHAAGLGKKAKVALAPSSGTIPFLD